MNLPFLLLLLALTTPLLSEEEELPPEGYEFCGLGSDDFEALDLLQNPSKGLISHIEPAPEPGALAKTMLEGGPSAVIAGCVNAISGDFFESEDEYKTGLISLDTLRGNLEFLSNALENINEDWEQILTKGLIELKLVCAISIETGASTDQVLEKRGDTISASINTIEETILNILHPMKYTFNNLAWNDVQLHSISINEEQKCIIKLAVVLPSYSKTNISFIDFLDCYGFKADMQFGLFSPDIIIEAKCMAESSGLVYLKQLWDNTGIDLSDLYEFKIKTKSINSEFKIYAKGFSIHS